MTKILSDKNLDNIYRWLSPPDPSKNLDSGRSLRHKDSGQWFLRSPHFSEWKTTTKGFLWLHGKPGCGKSVLSSTIIDHLQKNLPHGKKILYFYFDFSDTAKQSLAGALYSLVWQLYSEQLSARGSLDSLFASCDNGKRKPSITLLRSTFGEMIKQTGEVWIVVDALDECEWYTKSEEDALLPWIESIHRTEANVHLLVTGRPEQHIQSSIARWARSCDLISIQSHLVEADICDYVQTKVEHGELQRWKGRPEQRMIEATLMEKADGM
jgi:hypothetical protein